MHKHNCYTRKGDNHNLLIKTGNAHEERILPQAIINTSNECKGKGLKHSQK